MEANYSGGGGGDGSGGGADGGPASSNGNIKVNNTLMYQTGPPLTTLERFFWSQQSHFPHQQNRNTAKNSDGSVWAPAFGRLPCFGSATCGFLRPNCPQEASSLNRFMASEIPNMHLGEDIEVLGKNSKGILRKQAHKKGPSVSNLIKGKWNEEEDR